ncbi:MAG: hypothetical protein R3F20_13630 [Planctomycetota bacterium]
MLEKTEMLPVTEESPEGEATAPACAGVEDEREVLAPPGRRAIALAAQRGAAALATVLGVSCRFVGIETAFRPAVDERARFTVALAVGPDRLRIELDTRAARRLLDALMRGAGNLRGCGEPGEVECGMLEYLALEVLDRLTGPAGPPIEILEFGDGDALRTPASSDGVTDSGPIIELGALDHAIDEADLDLALRFRFDGAPLEIHLRIEGERAAIWRRPSFPAGRSNPEHAVAILLTRVALESAELSLLAPGALLLLEVEELEELVGEARVWTADGRDLGPVTELRDEPRSLTLHLDLSARAGTARPAEKGEVLVFLGAGREPRAPGDGARLRLEKPSAAPVRVLRPDGIELPGELVRDARGSIAVLLLESPEVSS